MSSQQNVTACGNTQPQPTHVYLSRYPSILPELNTEKSLCDFMFRCWEAAAATGKNENSNVSAVAFIQAETGEQLTYLELRDVTERFAEILYHDCGVRKGDVVCVMLANTIYYAPAVYAALCLGAAVTTASAMTTPDALSPQLAQFGCKVIFSSRSFSNTIDETATVYKQAAAHIDLTPLYLEDALEQLQKHTNLPSSTRPIPASYTPLEEATLDDVIFLPFSSGTAGAPKGVQITNRSIVANLLQERVLLDPAPRLATLIVLPFYHIYGFTTVMSSAMMSGATQVVMAKYNPELYLKCLDKFRVRMVNVAPPIIHSIVGRIEASGETLPYLRHMNNGAAPVSAEAIARLQAVAPGVALTQGYGMTEMAPRVAGTPSPQSANVIPGLSPFSSGVLVAGTELRVVKVSDSQQSGDDASEGIDCAPGEQGELWVRGPQMMKGYTDPAETAKSIVQDGWYRTGDIGYVDPTNESVFVTDRLKELIKYKGFQVSPVQLEGEVLKHPWVQDCVVVGVHAPGDASFEVARALVILKPEIANNEDSMLRAPQEIVDYVKERCPAHKQLHGGVRIVKEIQKSASGKVMRRLIRQEELERIKAAGAL